MVIPETRWAKTADGLHIAYQAEGDGPVDLVFMFGYTTHVEVALEEPHALSLFHKLMAFTRLIRFDKRGTGLSDSVSMAPTLDQRADDLRAVLDAVGSERAVVLGDSEAGSLAAYFGATHPDRTLGLILYDALARWAVAPDFPDGVSESAHRLELDDLDEAWGSERYAYDWAKEEMHSLAGDPAFVSWLAKWCRYSAAPGDAMAFERLCYETDVRAVLPSIRVPTLVITTPGPHSHGAYFMEHVPGARHVPLERKPDDRVIFCGPQDDLVGVIREFVEQLRTTERAFDQVLATVLFTDIVGSTKEQAELGNEGWRRLVEAHHTIIRGLLARYRGTEMDTAGDGFYAAFDGPARALACAVAAVHAVASLGIEIRAGLHTGLCERLEGKYTGLAVSIGARVAAAAGPSEVLVSSTVKDLVAGSGLSFEDTGEHELKGVPDRWRLYRVVGERT